MKISYDINKCNRNILERDLSFSRAADFCFETARYRIDERRDYGETRVIAVGYVEERLHVLCFVHTADGIQVISFCKANQRESSEYVTQ